jgi:hypothetical protein
MQTVATKLPQQGNLEHITSYAMTITFLLTARLWHIFCIVRILLVFVPGTIENILTVVFRCQFPILETVLRMRIGKLCLRTRGCLDSYWLKPGMLNRNEKVEAMKCASFFSLCSVKSLSDLLRFVQFFFFFCIRLYRRSSAPLNPTDSDFSQNWKPRTRDPNGSFRCMNHIKNLTFWPVCFIHSTKHDVLLIESHSVMWNVRLHCTWWRCQKHPVLSLNLVLTCSPSATWVCVWGGGGTGDNMAQMTKCSQNCCCKPECNSLTEDAT